jgi:ATP-dependent DNA helicase RecG
LAKDGEILKAARASAQEILDQDSALALPEHAVIRQQIESKQANQSNWARIS